MKRLIKKIWWYHWNEFSNPLTKGICAALIIFSIIAGIITEKYEGIYFFGGISYLMLLCDRGFGEPKFKDEVAK